MMEAASTSETLVNFYQTTRRNNPEDSHLRTRRRENLKSHGRVKVHGNITESLNGKRESFQISHLEKKVC
jgi:hypothetical protein